MNTTTMGRTERETTITDDYGEPHVYKLHCHPAGEGFDLLPVVVSIFAESLGEILSALDLGGLGAMSDDIQRQAASGELTAQEVIAAESGGGKLANLLDLELDGEKLGQAVSKLCQKLISIGGTALAKRLLKYTTRYDGQGRHGQKVNENFDSIYQANYGELAKALWFVVESNWGGVLKRLPFVSAG